MGKSNERIVNVSVVIPVYNGAATLQRCLQALAQQSSLPFELIIADNGSTDGSQNIVRDFEKSAPMPVRLIEVEKRGAAAARNAAVALSGGDWIAFTDSDCLPNADWLATGAKLTKYVKENVLALAGSAWGTLEGDGAARLLGLSSLSVGLPEQLIIDAGATGTQGFAAANLWVKRDAFVAIQGFDDGLALSGEDMDLCARLYAYGGSILYVPTLMVRHIHVSGVGKMMRKMVQYGQAHAFLFEKYGHQGVHLDLPWLGSRHFKASRYFWCNLVSAEKKALFLLLISISNPWLLTLLFGYIIWLGRGLHQRALVLNVRCGWFESMWLASLLIVKSAAMTWGRIRGSRLNVWVC